MTMTDETEAPPKATRAKAEPKLNIYQLISTISREAGNLAPVQTKGVPFPFRGVDGTVNHLAGLFQKYGVIVVPTVLEHLVSAREIDKGRAITQSEVTVKFTFYAGDGSHIEATTVGLAQDYADRSAAQAQSVAFRVALLQTFTLPTQQIEPEEAGENNAKYIKDGPAAQPVSRTQNALDKAGAAAKGAAAPAATGVSISQLQAQVKAAAGSKGLKGPEINALGAEIEADFFNSAGALAQLIAVINALPNKE